MEQLKYTLKEQIIEELNLEEITPEDIDNAAPLFGEEGLQLDSIDALELVVIMENYHGVKIPDEQVGKEVLYSIDTMADYIQLHNPA
ncbi:MAG: phosphopantetheine-binding protein [Bacteroidota bacterium]